MGICCSLSTVSHRSRSIRSLHLVRSKDREDTFDSHAHFLLSWTRVGIGDHMSAQLHLHRLRLLPASVLPDRPKILAAQIWSRASCAGRPALVGNFPDGNDREEDWEVHIVHVDGK